MSKELETLKGKVKNKLIEEIITAYKDKVKDLI